ncbi:hypothetical protein F5141DRAFT_1067335 [Pisolithus sp. B1]|nr:hypothetical protein F5141DRAFT_1067335 [Pisolithus sp. B1]
MVIERAAILGGRNGRKGVTLSDVGRCYHSFPKGTFHTHFTPPVFPRLVLQHFAAHSPTWTWTTRDGPGKGKSFKVPTIPIACDCNAPQVVCWIVMVFHSFKAHLNPITLDPKSIPIEGWLATNMSNPHSPKPPPPTQPSTPPTTVDPVSELQEELQLLCEKFYCFISSHEACCGHHSNSPSTPSGSSSKGNSAPSHSPTPTPLFTKLDNSPEGPIPVSDPPSWLVAALQHLDLPEGFTGELYSLPPPACQFPPMIITAVKLAFAGSTPFYLGIQGDKSFHVTAMADRALVATTIKLSADPSVPSPRL